MIYNLLIIDDLLIEFDEMGFSPTTVCPNPEEYAIEWREKVRAEFARIETENAELRERLEKAIELPRIIHPNETEWFIQYQRKSGIIDYNIRYSKESAESRLAELKGEFHETTN